MQFLAFLSNLPFQPFHPHSHKHHNQDRIADLDDAMQKQTNPKKERKKPNKKNRIKDRKTIIQKKRAEGGSDRRNSRCSNKGDRRDHHWDEWKRGVAVVDCGLLTREMEKKERTGSSLGSPTGGESGSGGREAPNREMGEEGRLRCPCAKKSRKETWIPRERKGRGHGSLLDRNGYKNGRPKRLTVKVLKKNTDSYIH